MYSVLSSSSSSLVVSLLFLWLLLLLLLALVFVVVAFINVSSGALTLLLSTLNSMLIIIQYKVHYNVHSTMYYRR